MTERPILFSGPMVKAILAGRKTQTRRVINPQPELDGINWFWPSAATWTRGWKTHACECATDMMKDACPYGVPGDRLWVRETWALNIPPSGAIYRADGEAHNGFPERWKPSIFLPRWASRITLEILSVRVEQLQQITWDDIQAEGTFFAASSGSAREFSDAWIAAEQRATRDGLTGSAWGLWANRWDAINGKRGCGYATNPWVWVIEFQRVGEEIKPPQPAYTNAVSSTFIPQAVAA